MCAYGVQVWSTPYGAHVTEAASRTRANHRACSVGLGAGGRPMPGGACRAAEGKVYVRSTPVQNTSCTEYGVLALCTACSILLQD